MKLTGAPHGNLPLRTMQNLPKTLPTNAAKETPVLGPEPAPTRSTSLPSSSPGDQGLPRGTLEQDGLRQGRSKSQLPAKGWKSPVNPTKKVSPCQSLLQLLRQEERRKAEVGKPSFHSITPSPWTPSNDNHCNFRKDLTLSTALQYCL